MVGAPNEKEAKEKRETRELLADELFAAKQERELAHRRYQPGEKPALRRTRLPCRGTPRSELVGMTTNKIALTDPAFPASTFLGSP